MKEKQRHQGNDERRQPRRGQQSFPIQIPIGRPEFIPEYKACFGRKNLTRLDEKQKLKPTPQNKNKVSLDKGEARAALDAGLYQGSAP